MKISYLLICILIVTLIGIRYFLTMPIYKNGDIVKITTVLSSEPIVYPSSQNFTIDGLKIKISRYPEISYGDRLVITGVVKDGVLDDAKVIEVGEKKNPISFLRNNLISFYQRSLPDSSSGLIAGIVLGSKNSLNADNWSMVKKVGLAHIVVASGTNITFVTSFILSFVTLFLKRKKAIFFVIFCSILYLFLVGFDAPLIRAVIMSNVAFLSQLVGRVVSAWRNLVMAALLMLLINPLWIFDIGFLLSFVSTASIMLFESKIRGLLSFLPEFFKEGASTSFAAQIGVSPILFVTFGQFNIWSPLANALVLWTTPLIMIIGAIGGITGLIIPFLGKLILYLALPLTSWFWLITGIFS